ncbi:MAG: GNAT family N-acetyltransferase [Gammaproteobacteria bacterium]|nr:GNAT family N-acetyltransferase [Gammaproteobacteria bacterium]
MPAALQCRGARPEDAPALSTLATTLGYPASVRKLATRLGVLLDHPDHRVLVAEREREVVGWIHGARALRLESDPGVEIGGLVVAASARRNGAGRLLVEGIRAWAAEIGVASLRVRSRIERDDARAFYTALGFRMEKTQAVFDLPLRTT